ncbi:MAG: alpha/beta hydrolase [Eubacteriales bacterium]|nr:alpha/beta hydrolase [Eubacteriales bacterium]
MREFKIALDNTYMNIIEFGHGKKVLTMIAGISLAGLEGSGEGVAAAYSAFADEYTVYLFDRRKVVPADFSIRDMANDVYLCLKEMGITSTDVYGVSQGGMIGQCLTLAHPELVNKLVICSSMCKATPLIKEIVERWMGAAKEHDVVKMNRMFFKDVYSEAFLDAVKDMLPELEKVGTAEDCDRFQNLARPISAFDIYDVLPEITCPVFVLGDMNDKVIGPEGSTEMAERLGCEIYLYDTYSHAVYDEAADIKERILEFLRK